MKKNKILFSLLSLALSLILTLSFLMGCNGNEEETETETQTEAPVENGEAVTDFDYENADISKYITLPRSEYISNTVTLSADLLVTDDEVNDYINSELFKKKAKTNGDTKVTDQPIKLGDSAFIYYTGYLDGVTFQGGSNADDPSPYELSIGSGSFIPGFEEGLIGIIPENTSKEAPYDLHLTFPKNYKNTDLAGKPVIFKVWIEYIVQYTIPEFNEDYVKNVQNFDGTPEEYKSIVRKGLEAEAEPKIKTEAMKAITNHLMENATIISYPEQSVNYWYNQYVDQYKYYMQYYMQYGYSFASFDDFMARYMGLAEGESWKDIVTEQAKMTVKEKLIAHAIVTQEGLDVADADFDNAVKYFIDYYKTTSGTTYSEEEIIEGLGEAYIKDYVLSEKVTNLLIDNCTVIYSENE